MSAYRVVTWALLLSCAVAWSGCGSQNAGKPRNGASSEVGSGAAGSIGASPQGSGGAGASGANRGGIAGNTGQAGQAGASDVPAGSGGQGQMTTPDAGTEPPSSANWPPWTPPPPPLREAPDCTGTTLACASRSTGGCTAGQGCRLDGDCGGIAPSCSGQISSGLCYGVQGCVWYESSGYCAGSAWSCSTFSGELTCFDQPGCYWNARCAGTAADCGSLSSASCESQTGCARSCKAGTALCGDLCVDLSDDEQNCAQCGHDCGLRGSCTAGRCECGAPTVLCNGRCLDVGSDVDNCGSCGQRCGSGYRCSDGRCEDIDECAQGSCHDGRSCENSAGGYRCGPCDPGLSALGDGCQDIDECATNHGGCDPLASCNNSYGSFACGACPQGYEGNGVDGCRDIDECQSGNGGCSSQRSCVNSQGGYHCGPCPAGYTESGATDCSDVDECATNHGGCDPLASCSNTTGSRSCGACPSGYTGDGESGCIDIDECASNRGGCDALRACQNSPGSYACAACPSGYTEDGQFACKDVDECATNQGGCDPLRACHNSTGGFSCGDCPAGYSNDGALRCLDVDECATNNGGCGSSCVNFGGGFRCACPPGARLLADGVSCYAPSWRAPVVLADQIAQSIVTSVLAMNAHGDAIAVYEASSQLFAARHQPRGSWSALDPIQAGGETSIRNPAAAVGAGGDGVVAWAAQFTSGPFDLEARRRDAASSGWQSARPVEQDAVNDAQYPIVALDGAGTGHTLWLQGNAIWFASAASAAAWSAPPTRLDAGIGGTLFPGQLALASDASGIATFTTGLSLDGGVFRTDLYASVRSTAGAWGSPQRMPIAGSLSSHALALTAQGAMIVGTTPGAWAVAYDPASGFGAFTQIAPSSAGGADSADVGADAQGGYIAVWRSSSQLTTSIVASRFTNGQGWSAPLPIESSNVNKNEPHVAVAASGDAVAVWSHAQGVGVGSVWASRYLVGSGWTAPTLISGNQTGSVVFLDVAISDAGDAVVLWSASDASAISLVAAAALE